MIASPLTREAKRILYLYEIADPQRPAVRQIGLGGLAPTAEIRTEDTPDGPIIRNEGVRPPKAKGRARLIEATGAIIGTVNNAVPDESGGFAAALERHADGTAPDFEVEGSGGTTHRIWLIAEPGAIARLQRLLAAEPEAYVADGNHRSAAAAMLGHESFLTVFFPADRMGISPYNRLVRLPGGRDASAVDAALERSFVVSSAGDEPLQPDATHVIGVYSAGRGWRALTRGAGVRRDGRRRSIDHDIVQRTLPGGLGIAARGRRLPFVRQQGRGVARGTGRRGSCELAVTLPARTRRRSSRCRQRRMMPTDRPGCAEDRSGLVMGCSTTASVSSARARRRRWSPFPDASWAGPPPQGRPPRPLRGPAVRRRNP